MPDDLTVPAGGEKLAAAYALAKAVAAAFEKRTGYATKPDPGGRERTAAGGWLIVRHAGWPYPVLVTPNGEGVVTLSKHSDTSPTAARLSSLGPALNRPADAHRREESPVPGLTYDLVKKDLAAAVELVVSSVDSFMPGFG